MMLEDKIKESNRLLSNSLRILKEILDKSQIEDEELRQISFFLIKEGNDFLSKKDLVNN